MLVGYTADELAGHAGRELSRIRMTFRRPFEPARLLDGEIGSYRLDMRLIGENGSAIWIDGYVATTDQEAAAP